ncbi:MAG: peptide deformylase [Alphaproteobacteria bacterium]|jgi:peptide deformylase|nr:peptide deformylase [Alphaproteobacteria bacterium]
MALRPILVAPDPRLKQVSEPVAEVTDEIRRLMDDMLETMYEAPGIGLAAIQVGVAKRVIVMDLGKPGDDEDEGAPKSDKDKKDKKAEREPRFFVNPEIVWASDDLVLCEEGCLSVPDLYEEVERPAQVRVRFLDYDGKQQEIDCDGMLAVCIQHEMDHLEGILFIDHLSRLKREMMLKKLAKARKGAERESA